MPQVVAEVAFVNPVKFGPGVNSFAVHLVVNPAAFVGPAVRVGVEPCAMELVVGNVANVAASVGPFKSAMAMFLVHVVAAFVDHSVGPLLLTLAVHLLFTKSAFILLPVDPEKLAVAICHAIDPLANVDASFSFDDPSLPLRLVVLPAPFEERPVLPNLEPGTLLLITSFHPLSHIQVLCVCLQVRRPPLELRLVVELRVLEGPKFSILFEDERRESVSALFEQRCEIVFHIQNFFGFVVIVSNL